jgi:hypothetical protein
MRGRLGKPQLDPGGEVRLARQGSCLTSISSVMALKYDHNTNKTSKQGLSHRPSIGKKTWEYAVLTSTCMLVYADQLAYQRC